jgi:hypothetical protein
MSDGEHSILAPSDAERWARCVGALLMSKGVEEPDKEYSASGTCSHFILERSLKDQLNPDIFLGQTMEFNGFKFVIDQDRIERVRATMVNIYREPGQMWVEHLLNTSPVLDVPNQIGHADIIKVDPIGEVIIKEQSYIGVLSVHDFKDGYLRVMAQDNLQGLLYLASALYEWDLATDIQALRFCIHQPKIGHYDEWSYTRKEIEDFTVAIRPAAKLAYQLYYGIVKFDPAQHLSAGDTQCFWCPVRGRCPARAQRIVGLFADAITAHEIDDVRLAQLYVRLEEIEQACKDYRIEAHRRAMMGRPIAGQKLVRGNKGKRKWAEPGRAESAMALLVPDDKMYQPRELISPTQAEKNLREHYASVQPFVTQSEGGLVLVPVDDPRAAVELPKFNILPEELPQ